LSRTTIRRGATLNLRCCAGGNVTEQGSVFCNPLVIGCPAAGAALAAALTGSSSSKPSGFIGGGEVGYNWQAGAWVYGLETDISGASISGSFPFSGAAAVAGFPGATVSASGLISEKLNYLGTVRGRAGYLVTPPLLVYATGGFAYGGVSSNSTLSEQVTGCGPCDPSPSVAASSSSTRTGWTVGGGVEWMFAPNWTVKGEYLYFDLGSVTYGLPALTQTTAGGVPFFGANNSTSVEFKGSIARAGVNYKF
jgi:outer membrane immunogenic protein